MINRTWVALAALAAAGSASAQSTVTLSGLLDTGVSRYSLGGVSKTLMSTSNSSSSNLTFKGTEDLGGGLLANFHLEAALQNDTGASPQTGTNNQGGVTGGGGLTFSRKSTLSLAGGFGEIRLGRDYSPSFWSYTAFDPFNNLGAAASTNVLLASTIGGNAVRSSNSLQYLYGFGANQLTMFGNGSGLYVHTMVSMGENASSSVNAAGVANKADGNYLGARVGYGQGPVNVAAAWGKDKNAAAGDYTYSNLGGSYDFGFAKLMGAYFQNKAGAGATYKAWQLSARIQLAQASIPVSFSSGKLNDAIGSTSNQFGLGYVYYLSKRTSLYATYSRLNNKTGALAAFSGGNGSSAGLAAAKGTGNGMDFGIKTSF